MAIRTSFLKLLYFRGILKGTFQYCGSVEGCLMGWATGQIAVRDKKLTPETPYILFSHLLGHRANPEHPLAGGAGTRDQIEMQETEEQRERKRRSHTGFIPRT